VPLYSLIFFEITERFPELFPLDFAIEN